MKDPAHHYGRLPDEELVERACAGRDGKSGCLEELLNRHRPAIFRRCLGIIGDRDDADDVTQEVLLRVLRGLDGYERRSSFRTWLHTIVQNECWTFSAKRGRHSIPEDVQSKIRIHFSAHSHVHTNLISRDQLRKVLGKMPHQAREILQLRYLRDLPLPQIARQLGMTLSATKMRLYRALSSGQSLMIVATKPSRTACSYSQTSSRDERRILAGELNAGRLTNAGRPSKTAERPMSS